MASILFCVWLLCQGQRADIMIFAKVSLWSPPCPAVGEGLHSVVWGRGLEAPVEDSCACLVLGAAGSVMICDTAAQSWVRQWPALLQWEQAALSTPYQCSLHRLLQTWISGALLRSTVVVLWHTFPCERLSPALVFPSCSPQLFFLPLPLFLSFFNLPKWETHTLKSVSLFWWFIVMGWQECAQLLKYGMII